jgi:hypothetical protein
LPAAPGERYDDLGTEIMEDPHHSSHGIEASSDAGADAATPRWVRFFGLVGIVLALVFVALHLAGGGFHGHGAAAEHGAKQP